jgi:hypothetical protein
MPQVPNRWSRPLLAGLAFLLPLVAGTSRATLGEPVNSLESNRATLKALHKSTSARGIYTVYEDVADGVTVRQFVSPDGMVFAVAWDGVSHPDLASLLGNYYDDYRQLLRSTPRKPGKRQLQLRGSRVIVEKWGHMRNLQGRAYAPALLPRGVDIDEIR